MFSLKYHRGIKFPKFSSGSMMTYDTTLISKRSVSILPPSQITRLLKDSEKNVIPIDCSWYMPNVPIVAFHEFMKRRLGDKSVFFDIDQVKDESSKYPHMLPSKEKFSEKVSELGIKKDDDILLYDQQGIFSVCRAAWMFEIFGHDPNKIHILNTFPGYIQSFGNPNLVLKIHEAETFINDNLTTQPTSLPKSNYKVDNVDNNQVILYEELLDLVQSGKIGKEFELIDARSTKRFTGEDPEPRPGLLSGHVPGAKSLPFTNLLTPTKSLLSSMSLKPEFENIGIDDSKPIIVMCGTGVTACIVRTGLLSAGLGKKGIIIYDGSWTEWGQRAPAELISKN
ncbi:hypothetical protein BVG19_g2997 [[Candida] boidinii]|nr:hypothetical protein BVG19_g2997 [[Candida] boidinii]OWB51980.1 hypothetical protein B5S27_g3551 [[Candida] boidinii]